MTPRDSSRYLLSDCCHANIDLNCFTLQRVQKVRRKIEQAAILKAQGEIRETRTRLRQTRRPDYVDYDVPDDEVSLSVLF